MISLTGYTWSTVTAGMGDAKDGVMAAYFTATGKHHRWGGWSTGTTTFNTQFDSPTGGTWTSRAAAPWTGRHAVPHVKVGEEVFMVGGDPFNITNDGAMSFQSWKFDGTTWTKINENCGIGSVWGGELLYFNSAFYYICGQQDLSRATIRKEVWRSTDGCNSFSKIGDVPFAVGLTFGNSAVYKGKIWVIGGTKYDSVLTNRTYPRHIWSTPDGINWNREGKMPYTWRSRHFSKTFEWNGILWMMGGLNTQYSLLNIAEVWATDNPGVGKEWVKQTTPFTTGRHALTAWIGPDAVYIGWGTSDGGLMADVQKLTAP